MESSALEEIEAAKAKQNSLRERLAARRQQRQSLLADVSRNGVGLVGFPVVPGSSVFNPSYLLGRSAGSLLVGKTNQPTLGTKLPTTKGGFQAEKQKNTPSSDGVRDVPTLTVGFDVRLASPATPADAPDGSVNAKTKAPPPSSQSVKPAQSPRKAQSNVVAESPASLTVTVSSANLTQSNRVTQDDKGAGIPAKKSHKRSLPAPTEGKSGNLSPGVPTKRHPDLSSLATVPPSTVTSNASSHSANNLKDSNSLKSELEDLLGAQTAREKEDKRIREEILELLNTPTAKERYLSERFRSQGGSQVQQFCAYGTRAECNKAKIRTGDREPCTKLHFRKIIHPHTDESLGDCSFLNTCFHVDTCKYVHYAIDYSDQSTNSAVTGSTSSSVQTAGAQPNAINTSSSLQSQASGKVSDTVNSEPGQPKGENENAMALYPPQWINCDIRLINMSILGKFAVIMADPPWDIHMELPYGTMSDDEMRRMDIPCLQDDGYIFLWVTGRAMELGRECLRLWGYQRVDEIIWVKTNQLQRLIRTGRTGHWLNHGKEHCLVGVKGKPQGVNRGLDCDVIVSEVRETSHKPDEIYGIIERLSPGTRKLELFGRPHNLQPNWITLGNQLDGTYLVDPLVVERFKKQYPNGLDAKSK
ncbi:unnamed protein product [Calicophoron daubneyi]|uniref:mRNA m(6)A methyltransferase n=1 Tax=Calicophoron daubneyi TaxID=300641 RepID=A0AAV2T139_CALDB